MLRRKGIHVRQYQFAKLNVGTFAVASVVSGVVLIGQTRRRDRFRAGTVTVYVRQLYTIYEGVADDRD